MNEPGEIEALKSEQRRLRASLDQLDRRIATLEQGNPAPPEEVVPAPVETPSPVATIPPPPSSPLPTFDAETTPVASSPVAAPPPAALPPPAKPTAPPSPRESFELRFGQVWLVRIGIVILLTGLVFLGNFAYHELVGRLGPGGKLALLYLAGFGIGGLGRWVSRKTASLRAYGRVLLAGGCATIYYATYAAHFSPTLRVIESPILGGLLLLGLGGIFAFLADRQRSQALAAATIALSFYTAAINGASTFSLFSNLVISATAVALLARRSWASVSFLSLLGSYGSFAFWRVQQTASLLPTPGMDAGTFWAAVLFPVSYWLVHTTAVLWRRTSGLSRENQPTFLTLNNAACFALVGPVVYKTHPGQFWLCAIVFGAVLTGLAALTARRAPEDFRVDKAYLSQGLTLLLLGALFKFTGWQLALSFALLSGTLVSLGKLRHGGVYRFFSGAAALVSTVAAWEAVTDNAPHARLTTAAVAVILLATAWLLRRQAGFPPRSDWRAFFFVILAGLLASVAATHSDLDASAIRCLGVALVATIMLPRVGLREAGYVAQPLALFGQGVLAAAFVTANLPAWQLAISAAFGLSFIHQWQWPPAVPLAGRRTWQTLHTVFPVLLTIVWGFGRCDAVDRPWVFALIAALLLAYAFATQAGALAAASVPLSLGALGTIAYAISTPLPWGPVTLATALFAAQSLILKAFGSRATLPASFHQPIRQLIRSTAVLIGAAMVFAYVPANAWFLTLTAAGFGAFLLQNFQPSREAAFYAVGFGATAVVVWLGRIPVSPVAWPDAFGLAAFAAAQRIGRRQLPAGIQAGLCAAAALGAWILVHRLGAQIAGGFLLTVAWSLLALVVLGVGFALRERTYRLLGLLILCATLGRIFLVDVWQLETIYRILSFLVLGAVLITLSFLYNRYAEALKKWI